MVTGSGTLPERRAAIWRPLVCTTVGMVGNILMTAAKLFVGMVGGSASLVADGLHSFSDLAGDVGLLIALKASGRPPDSNHPYGHYNYETLGALGASMLLIVTGVLVGRDAVIRMMEHESSTPETITLVVAFVSIIIKEGMARYTLIAAKYSNSPALRTNAAHHRSDALSSIAAVVGILGAIAGLPILDSLAALVIAFWIVKMGWELLRDNAQILMEASPDEDLIQAVETSAKQVACVCSVSGLRVRPRGSVYMADISITVSPEMSVGDGHTVAHLVEETLKSDIPGLVAMTVHIEPHQGTCNKPSCMP
jgi:cation diffusion facilitator family transporter